VPPEDNPKDEVQPTKEEWEAAENERLRAELDCAIKAAKSYEEELEDYRRARNRREDRLVARLRKAEAVCESIKPILDDLAELQDFGPADMRCTRRLYNEWKRTTY
jgi:hypothetical protein